MMSALAWLMAQPWPVKLASSMTPFSTRSCRLSSSPQLGFTPSCVAVGCSISYL